jgi:3-oxoacyl-(acyl-carrier-protein) synthase
MSPDELAYVNAHGTSTPLNDRSETAALKAALGDAAMHVPVSSTKSAIGHLLGAAGAVEAIATVLALRERLIPPTLGFEEREEGLDLDYVPGSARPITSVNAPAELVAARAAAPASASSARSASTTTPSSAPSSNGSAPASRAIGMSNSFGFGGHNAVLVFAA